MKKCFEIIIKDSLTSCFMVHIPAENKAKALKEAEGNGEVISCKEIEWRLGRDCVMESLKKSGFGQTEINLIDRLLSEYHDYF